MLVRKSVHAQQVAELERQLTASRASERECLAIKGRTNYIAISAAGMILESSPQFEALSGFSKLQLTCEHIDNLLLEPLTQTRLFQSLLQPVTTDSMPLLEFNLKQADGTLRHISAQFVPIADDSQTITKVIAFIQDHNEDYLQRQKHRILAETLHASMAVIEFTPKVRSWRPTQTFCS